MTNSKLKKKNIWLFLTFHLFLLGFLCFGAALSFAQDDDLEINLDVNSSTIPLPKVFKPNVDLSGRGFYHDRNYPQQLASQETLNVWGKDIGFNNAYRIQYNLWAIGELAKNPDEQKALLANYENIIKQISDSGGTVLLNIFGTPSGLGKVRDKRSSPFDLRAYKGLIKEHIRYLSCQKRYNIWYEFWNAPDSDDFFLGGRQEYLNLYRVAAEAIKELEAETKIHILLGGPGTTWWFRSPDGNNVLSPEKSLVYALIQFCYNYRLPLDFISWHAYATDSQAEKEITVYHQKSVVALMRDWLTYFRFDRDTPIIISEWNYDRGANLLPEREEKAFITASYIPCRLRNMYESGIDYQFYYCLEDFQSNPENITRNVGIFGFDAERAPYKATPKSIYGTFVMLSRLGDRFYVSPKIKDDYVSVIATSEKDSVIILISNYINPRTGLDYVSRNLASFNDSERVIILNLIKTGKFEKAMRHEIEIVSLRLNKRVNNLLKQIQQLSDKAEKFRNFPRVVKLSIKNLKDQEYRYQRFMIDASFTADNALAPLEEKNLTASTLSTMSIEAKPYSTQLIVISKKPEEPKTGTEQTKETPAPVAGAAVKAEQKDTKPDTKEPAAVKTEAKTDSK